MDQYALSVLRLASPRTQLFWFFTYVITVLSCGFELSLAADDKVIDEIAYLLVLRVSIIAMIKQFRIDYLPIMFVPCVCKCL